MGTCERRLPPPPPPRHAARREHTNERRPTPTAAASPHTDASMRARVYGCTRIHTRARSTRREQQWQLRSVSLPPQAVLPPLVFAPPFHPHESRASTDGGAPPPWRSLWVTKKRLCISLSLSLSLFLFLSLSLSLLMVPLLFSKAVRTKKIQSTTRFLSLLVFLQLLFYQVDESRSRSFSRYR